MLSDNIPVCPGPLLHQSGPATFKIPVGAVDTHAHVISLDALVSNRSYTPPEATTKSYIAMLDAVGMTYGVLIQVSVNGSDNEPMLRALSAYPQRLRGVAVPALGLADAEYQRMKDLGVVGLRINVMFSGGGLDLSQIEACDALARDWGWHIQFLMDANDLPQLRPRIDQMKSDIVIDHMGYLPASQGVHSQGFQSLLALVKERAWVKISGAYRLSEQEPLYLDTIEYAQQLVQAAPSRCVWGSDWPHVAHWRTMPSVGQLLDTLALWVPDEATRNQILTTNAQKLYQFI